VQERGALDQSTVVTRAVILVDGLCRPFAPDADEDARGSLFADLLPVVERKLLDDA
jgi:hypothetical protein